MRTGTMWVIAIALLGVPLASWANPPAAGAEVQKAEQGGWRWGWGKRDEAKAKAKVEKEEKELQAKTEKAKTEATATVGVEPAAAKDAPKQVETKAEPVPKKPYTGSEPTQAQKDQQPKGKKWLLW